MWYNNLSNNKFLLSLYNHVPNLIDVRIEELAILREGDKIKLVFDMPKYVDNIPRKWLQGGYNAITVELNFWNIQNFNMYSNNLETRGNIEIVDNSGKLRFLLDGNIHCEFIAEIGMIQKIQAYIRE